MTTQFGYACINMSLQERKPQRVFCSRGMIKRTFMSRGLEYASQLGLQNAMDLIKIIAWNNEQGVKVFRITSCMFPWHSEYDLTDLPDYEGIKANLEYAGKLARDNGQRLSTHPGQFNVLTSQREQVVLNAIDELDKHGIIFDIMGMPRSPAAKINIHIGGAYGDRQAAIDRWCKNYERLSESARSRLTVENDDKPALYSTKMLYDTIVQRTGTPIVFDSHHFECGPQDSSYDDAFHMAVDSWPDGVRPQCHHSNSRKRHENPKARVNQHSDWYYEQFNDCGFSVDVVLESKRKERALFKYISDFEMLDSCNKYSGVV
jgi:UV DNA damage endonuclease